MTIGLVCGFRENNEHGFGRLGPPSDEAILKLATEQGFSLYQTKICSTLAKNGPLTFESISEMLKLEEPEVCRAILRLQKRGLVYVEDSPLRLSREAHAQY